MSRITFEVMRAFGGKWLAMIFVDGHLVAKRKCDSYEAAYSWACQEQSAREREVKER